MRVLFLNPTGFIGGGERQLLQMMAALRASEPSIENFLITLGDGDLVREAERQGWTVRVLAMPAGLETVGDSAAKKGGRIAKLALLAGRIVWAGPAVVAFVIELRKLIASLRPDVIHSNGIKTHVLSRFVCPAGVPLIWHVHDYFGLRPLAARLLFATKGRVTAAVAVSESVRRDAETVLRGVPVRTVLNAVDVSRFAPASESRTENDCGVNLDALAGLEPAPSGTLRVGLVATFARWKGHAVFLAAAQRVLKTTTRPVRFFIVGGAIYHTENQFALSELKALAREMGLEFEVGFVPFQKNIEDVYRALDVVVHASTLAEPFGLTIVEAMACGRAVIVSNAGGAAELFTDGIDALGTAPGNAEALALAIGRLVEDGALRARLGLNARSTVLRRFDARRLGGELLDLYGSVLKT